jgi:hypothetical protein
MTKGLSDFEPFIVVANVRSRFSPPGLCLTDGVGQQGDLVLGEVRPRPGEPLVILDQALQAHTVTVPTRVLTVLGTRDSATHVNAGIPEGGLPVYSGSKAYWIAGESGMVGDLFHEAIPNPSIEVETSAEFSCLGLVQDPVTSSIVNVEDLAIQARASRLTTAMICVAATSAEAGKTVLAGEIIRLLVDRGIRVGAVKVTGTGGTLDSIHHRRSGAAVALDQVDAGMITTYTSPETFRTRIVRSFRYAQDLGVGFLVAELGGDLIYANNPTFLSMPEMRENIRSLLVINNDPLSCLGARRYLEVNLGFPRSRIRMFSSPFRNFLGMSRRMGVLGIEALYDVRDLDHLRRVVEEALG